MKPSWTPTKSSRSVVVFRHAWEIREDWDLGDSWSVFGSGQQSELFFNPADIQEVIEGFNKANA